MEYAYGEIWQAGAGVTGRIEIGLKTTPAAASYDFWGGALRVARQCPIINGKATLHLEDGRTGKILVDGVGEEDDDGSRVVTFIGCAPLQRANLQSQAGNSNSPRSPGNATSR
jgi:hypothetical protein